MRVLIFSDIHNDLKALERLAKTPADYYICAGDLVSWERGLDACGEILCPLGDRLLVIPGNHESAEGIAAFASRFGFREVHGQQLMLGDSRFACLGYSNPTPFDTPGEYTEQELAARLADLAEPAPDVVVCHCPPFETDLDRMRNGAHAGSTAVRAFLEAVQPRLFFSGHIHETEGVETVLGNTTGRNAGKRGYLLEL